MNFKYRIIIIYVIIGFLWIILSDFLLCSFIHDVETLATIEIYKGIFYVIVTGILLYVLVNRYVKQQEKIRRDLEIARDKAEESERLKTAFLQNISHEIRTPMNGIVGYVSMLKEKELVSEKYSEYAEVINSSAGQLLDMVNDIIDISRIEAGENKLNLSGFSIFTLIDNLKEKHEEAAKAQKLELRFLLPPKDYFITTDREKLYRILSNLLSNGIKFTREGYVSLKFEIIGTELVFTVEDSGIGIDKEKIQAIFDSFIQLETGSTKNFRGIGLGLAIARGYSDLLGGKLSAHSLPRKGSRFVLEIPNKKINE